MKSSGLCLVERICTASVTLLAAAALTFFLQQSVFLTTVDVSDNTINHFYAADSPLPHFLLFLVLCFLFFLAARRKLSVTRRAAVVLDLLTLLVLGGLFWFTVSSALAPVADSWAVFQNAQRLLQGDAGGLSQMYWQCYPNQCGILLYMMLLIRICGSHAILVCQALNVVWLGAAIWFLSQTVVELSGQPAACAALYRFLMAVFLPFTLYVTFMYGTIPGLALASVELWSLTRYRRQPRAGWLLLMGAAGGLAAIVKQNYLIVSVAVAMYLLWDALSCRRRQSAAAIGLLFVCLLGAQKGARWLVYNANGVESPAGLPALAWVDIGLRAEPPGMEGWWSIDSYTVWSALESGGAETADAVVRQRLADSLKEFREDPSSAVRFFARKMTSQWNMPTFESIYIQHNRPVLPGHRMSNAAASVFSPGRLGYSLYTTAANLLLTQLWAGLLLYLLLGFTSRRLDQLVFFVIFLGGVLFHFAWEAKAQYTVVYVFLLLPYAWQGFCLLGRQLAGQTPAGNIALELGFMVLLCGVLVASGLCGEYLSCSRSEAVQEASAYRQWITEQAPVLSDGTFYIEQSNRMLCIDLSSPGAHLTAAPGADTPMTLRQTSPIFEGSHKVYYLTLAAPDGSEAALGLNSYLGEHFSGSRGAPSPTDTNQYWFVELCNDGYRLGVDGFWLTLDEETGTLSFSMSYDPSHQVWHLLPL